VDAAKAEKKRKIQTVQDMNDRLTALKEIKTRIANVIGVRTIADAVSGELALSDW